MSIDKSLRRKNTLVRARGVLSRTERIRIMMDDGRWTNERSPYGLPKTRVRKIVIKKAKKEKDEAAPADAKKK